MHSAINKSRIDPFWPSYVTNAPPKTSLRQETLFRISCKQAEGQVDEGNIRRLIYDKFMTRQVSRISDVRNSGGSANIKSMTYWRNGNTADARTSFELLANSNANGTCEAWSMLLRDVFRIQGIPAARWDAQPRALDQDVQSGQVPRLGLAVKNWSFSGAGSSGDPNYPYRREVDAIDAKGIPGQGQGVEDPDPPGIFGMHCITESGGIYYDPSYGTPPISGAKKDKLYEDSAFDGYENREHYIRKNNTGGNSASEVYYMEYLSY